MKTLSLKQPFAELVASGKKKIELRKWSTKFRGKFLIHASKIPDKKAMKRFDFRGLLCGFIVGKATLIDVKDYGGIKKNLKKIKICILPTRVGGILGLFLKMLKE